MSGMAAVDAPALTPATVFGPWIRDLDTLLSQYKASTPFPHIQIFNFFNDEFAARLAKEFPSFRTDNLWDRYFNPVEVKLAVSSLTRMPPLFQETLAFLSSDEVASIMRQFTGIKDLRADSKLYGAGLHCSPRGGKLGMHLDYSVHPLTGEERRLNMIIYLTKEWNEEWGGALDLADPTNTTIVDSFPCHYNSAGLFETGDISFHGFEAPVSCPDSFARNSLALYYVSDARPDVTRRLKAEFRPIAGECSDGLKALYEIRKSRRITEDDIRKHVPGWLEEHADDVVASVMPYVYEPTVVTDPAAALLAAGAGSDAAIKR